MRHIGFFRARIEVPKTNVYKNQCGGKHFFQDPVFWISMGVAVMGIIFVVLLATHNLPTFLQWMVLDY